MSEFTIPIQKYYGDLMVFALYPPVLDHVRSDSGCKKVVFLEKRQTLRLVAAQLKQGKILMDYFSSVHQNRRNLFFKSVRPTR